MTHQKEQFVKPGIKKSAAGKTLRVATAFTGAAACAAAFMPAAMAGTGHHAQPDGKKLAPVPVHGPIHGVRPDHAPESTKSCSNTPHWMHMYGKNYIETCFGYSGIFANFNPIPVSQICGGNNQGHYGGHSVNGQPVSAAFHEGTTYAHLPWKGLTAISWVNISHFTGNDTCKSLPALTAIR